MSAEHVFQKLATVIPPLDGWCTVERAHDIASVIIATRPENVTIIGVWAGRDTLAAALALRHVGAGCVLAIDPWQAQASAVGQTGEDLAWWNDQEKHELIYTRFRKLMADHQLGPDIVDVRRQKSDDVKPPKSIGLLISDGNHGPQAIRDIKRFAPNVTLGGFAYLDDLNWVGGSVQESVKLLQKLGFALLYERDTGAWFQRLKK